MTRRDDLQRLGLHPLAPAFQNPTGGPMDPACGPGLPRDLMPQRSPAQGVSPNFNVQVPPIAVMEVGNSAPDFLMRVRGFTEIAAGDEGNARAIEFPDDGWVIAIQAVARANGTPAAQAALQFRATVGEEMGQLISDGLAGTWMPFSFCGQTEWEWQPLARRVSKLERWEFLCRNTGEETALLPDIALKFRALRSPGMARAMLLGPELAATAPIIVSETAPDRYVRVQGLEPIEAGGISNEVSVQFPEDGYITAMLATPGAGDLDPALVRTSLGLQLQLGDTGAYLTTDGQSADYHLLSAWGNTRARWLPYFRAVSRLDRYTVTLFNFHASELIAAPEVLFKFRSARSLAP
jgi:hypothetical protein